MFATAADYPRDEARYAFEPKWDGIRALAFVADGRVVLRSRNELDITSQYPELAPLADWLRGHDALLDGEIVAFDESGRADFQRLQGRFGISVPRVAQRKAEEDPITYVVFDLLHLDGLDLTKLPYEERRSVLESLDIPEPRVRVSPSVVGSGRAILATPGVEGVVAKQLGSAYAPGARSRAWLKIKTQRRQEFVIGGWTPGQGARRGKIGALLIGVYDGDRLLHAGSVGTGFTDRTLDEIQLILAPYVVRESPFAEPVGRKDAVFVEPRFVAEVEFTEWTKDGKARHPSFKGLRNDKDAKDVVREDA
jgi:bifunctional non-homologous end joining protein LigD